MARTKPWHRRWHGNALHGYMVLTLEQRGAYTTLLDLMYDAGGPIWDDHRYLCGYLRCDPRVWRRIRQELIDLGKLRQFIGADGRPMLINGRVETELGHADHNPSERKLAQRADTNLGSTYTPNSTPTCDVADRLVGEKVEAEQRAPARRKRGERKEEREPLPLEEKADLFGLTPEDPGPPPKPPEEEALELWNDLAQRANVVPAMGLTDKRKSALKQRLNGVGVPVFKEVLAKVEANRFLCGEGRPREAGAKPFRASLDYILRPDQWIRIREGFYEADRRVTAAPNDDPPETWGEERWARVIERWKHTGVWPDHAGPPPGRPDYKGPEVRP